MPDGAAARQNVELDQRNERNVRDLDTAGRARAGAADYLTKPFPLRYLDAVLAVHLPHDQEPSRA